MKHEETSLNADEQVPERYNLFDTMIRSIGLAQSSLLQPYLQSRLEKDILSACWLAMIC